jgi:DNA-binding MarR family transcriptional regulator
MERLRSSANAMPQGRRAAQSPLSSVLHLLHRAGQRADNIFSRQAGIALTLRQFMILQVIAEASGPSQVDVVRATGIDRSSVSDLVKRLVSFGWLKRRRTKRDARTYAVRLTQEGRRILALGIPAALATEEFLLSSFSAAQRRAVLRGLITLAFGNASSHPGDHLNPLPDVRTEDSAKAHCAAANPAAGPSQSGASAKHARSLLVHR